jgi:Ca2+-binding RTX toxin-like protein
LGWRLFGRDGRGHSLGHGCATGRSGGFGPAPSGQTIEGTAGDDALVGTDGDDTIYGHSGSDTLSGGLSNDRLFGGDGNDTLNGGVGADTLNGGLGRDTLYAGPGDGVRDLFVFASTAESPVGTKRDVVHDFISGLDELDLSGIDANSRTAGDDLFKFSGTTAQAHSVWYAAGRGEVILRADVNGDMKADFEIRLVGLKGMTADDFIL